MAGREGLVSERWRCLLFHVVTSGELLNLCLSLLTCKMG